MVPLITAILRHFDERPGASHESRRASCDVAVDALPKSRTADAPAVERRSYRDERDLARQLAELDEEFDALRLTVVVVLDERTRARFRDATVRRRTLAQRLTITTTFGAGPARDFVGDLAARAHSLGWVQIVCERHCDRAVRNSIATTDADETCVVFLPS